MLAESSLCCIACCASPCLGIAIVMPSAVMRLSCPAARLQPAQLLCGIAERGAHVHFMFVYRDPLRSVRPTGHA